MHIQCIQVYKLFTKLQLQNCIYIRNNLTHTQIYIYYELEHYEIEYIMQYEIIWIYEYEIIWTRSLGKWNYIYMNMKLHNLKINYTNIVRNDI